MEPMGGYYMKTYFIDTNGTRYECRTDIVLPVTCQTTGDTYVNMQCAFLNNAFGCKDWSLQSECASTKSHPNDQCKSYLIPPGFAELRYCDTRRSQPIISQCPKNNNSSPSLRLAEKCANYFYLVYAEDGQVYKNIFCYACNDNPFSVVLSAGDETPSTILTNFADQFEKAVYRLHCDGTKAWMDFEMNKCRPIRCHTDKILRSGYCEYDNRTALGNLYHLMLQSIVKPNSGVPVYKQAIHNMVTFLSYKLMTSDYQITITNPELIAEKYVIYVDIWFTVNANISLNDFEELVLAMRAHYFRLYSGVSITAHANYSIVTHASESHQRFSPNLETGLCCSLNDKLTLKKDKYEPITHQLMCPYIEFTINEYVLRNTTARIDHLNLSLNKDEFSVYKDQLRVCFELFLYKTGFIYDNRTYHLTVESTEEYGTKWYVSAVCLTISMIALGVTFITYTRLSEMRTQPVKNNMALTINLFLAQLTLVTGVDKVNNPIACIIMGITIHYFWLSMVFWMNVCSYHMFKVFVLHKLVRVVVSNGFKQMLIYLVYANGTPILITVAVIVSNYVLSGGTSYGYGGNTCYLSTAELILYSFVLPLSLVILTNIIFFALTVITIHRVKQSGKQTGDRNNIIIYTKLSVVTGCFWLFAILSNVVTSPALDYLSIILNSSQGIFLCWSFLLNKTMFNKCRRQATESSELSTRERTG
ncbi:hypothetical protein SNE40_003383 [Patella caerulea]